jgi:hypothetical protein
MHNGQRLSVLDRRLLLLLLSAPFVCPPVRAQAPPTPLDIVLILEPVSWQDSPGGRVSRVSQDLRLEPGDRLALIELIGAPKVKSKLEQGNQVVAMRARPSFRFGVSANQPDLPGRRIYDALSLAATQFEPGLPEGRRRLILLVTSDQERGSRINVDGAATAVADSHATLVVLHEALEGPRQGASVEPLVEKLAGRFLQLSGREPLAEAIAYVRAH